MGDSYTDCNNYCNSAWPASADPDGSNIQNCYNNCDITNPTSTSTSSSSGGGAASKPASTSSGSGSFWTAAGQAGGGLLSGLFGPKPTIVTGGIDPTTMILIGGGILAVVLLTRKRD